MDPRTAWVLNLDADLELGAAGPYAPTHAVLAAMRPHREALAASLVPEGAVIVDEASPAGAAAGAVGRAFCPTPRALALLRRAGAEPERHPPAEVLRRVNARCFAMSLGPTLPGAGFLTDLDALRAWLSRAPPVGEDWRCKRRFGMAGRGHRRIGPNIRDDDDAYLRASLVAHGGIAVEPNVAIVEEFAIHGRLDEAGGSTIGPVVRQVVEGGVWRATLPAPDAPSALRAEIEREAESVARALHAAGYFGPFNVDAFTYRGHDGRIVLQPRSEINARYSMGFARAFPAAAG